MTKATWTLAVLVTLGGSASADDDSPSVEIGRVAASSGSKRGYSHDYLVAPAGGELTGRMRFLMSEPAWHPAGGSGEMKFSDVALFGLGGRWSIFSKLELSLEASFLAKQPSATDEKPWQSIGGAIRSPIGKRAALQISAAGGHLIDHVGMWTKEAVLVEWRKPVADIMKFDLAFGFDGVSLSAPDAPSAFIAEVALATTVTFHDPRGFTGGWVGVGYALPIAYRGQDPTTGMSVDPQPRLDFRLGAVLSIVKQWDVFAEFAIVDRGDIENPATRLPILDGGFDQRQILLGVTRHFEGKPRRRTNDDDYALVTSR